MNLPNMLQTLIFFLALGLSSYTKAQTFVYCAEASPSIFNPQLATDGTTNNATATMYNKLVDFKYAETTIVPDLAESWTVSKDQMTYTFKIRQGVHFHTTSYFTPTRTLNADDILFSINRQRLDSHPYHKIGGGTYQYFQDMDMGKIIKDLKKIDDYTIKFTLSKPEAPFLANLAMPFMSILSKEYADQLEKQNKKDNIDQFPVGTGPFVFRRYVKDTMIRYRSHGKYWERGLPKVENLVIAITPDANVRYQKLKVGECHLIYSPAPADIQAMNKDKNITVMSTPGLNVGYLAMNTQKKPFDNILVRQAVNHALNKASYIQAIYLGNAVEAHNPLPPMMWSYDKTTVPYNYNVAKAKELLKEAGFPNGFEAEMWTLPVSRPYNPNGKKMGEMMQADLAKVGIKIKLITFDWPTYLQKSRQGEHQFIQLGWTGDNGDPDNFLNILLGCTSIEAGSNVARWCDKPFNDLVVKAKGTTNTQERIRLYQQAQKIFKTAAPWAPLVHSVVYRAMSTKVKGYKITQVGADVVLKYVELQQ